MAAQDAELKLKVSLDLAFFRQQLAGLGQAAAGYKIPLQVQFDRRGVQSELNALAANIRRRNYYLEVKTNLPKEIQNAEKLAKALRELESISQKTKGGASRATGGSGTVNAANFQSLIGNATKPALEALYAQMQKLGIKMAGIGKGTVKELGSSIMSGVPQITEDLAQGIAKGLSPKMKVNGRQGAKSFIDAFKDAAGIASPSKVFQQLGEFSADGLEIGFLNGLKEFKGKAVSEIKKIVALMKLELASVGDVNLRAGAGSVRAGVRGGAQYMAPIGPLPLNSAQPWARGSRGMYGGGGYEPYMATQGFGGGGRGTLGVSSVFSSPSMLGIGRLALPAAGQTSASISQQARIAQAYARSSERSASVFGEDAYLQGLRRSAGQVPLGGGRFLPPGGGGGGGGGGGFFSGGMGDFRKALGATNLPGAGTIRELGQEFGFAAKQVLLFGTAYKALAFITDFPAQVGNAVGQLQTFKNTLGAISPTAKEAAASNQLILDLVDRYNIPLQSARDGFTKLYASMAPAGFSGEEIRTLFTGISQAAATFGMSADKVDRVNYAFAQMASKGQVMSEELKGQLGDVLPGAMAIFAEAAGFKGPKAIQDFSAALEEGRYKGEAMVALLKNVGVVMSQEFGPGAEGAARTFQGTINRMQNSLRLLYESFEPVAVGFLNSVVVPMTQGIKQVADGVNAFMSGSRAQTAGGFALAQELERLKPAFDGIRANASGVVQQLGALAKTALDLAKVFLQIAGNPVVGYLAKLYVIILPLNMALTVMRGLWAANVTQLLIFNARVATGTGTLTAFRAMMAATGGTAQTTAAAIRGAGLTLRTFFASTGVGLVLVGISALIERFMSLNQRLEETKLKAAGAAQAIRSMSSSEARTEQFNRERTIRDLGSLGGQQGFTLGGRDVVQVPGDMAKRFEGAGIPVQTDLTGRKFLPKTSIAGFLQQQQQLAGEAKYRQAQLAYEEKQAAAPVSLGAIPASEQEGKGGRKVPLNEMLDLESQRQFKMREADTLAQLNKRISDAKRQGNEYEAESLESTREALRLGIETAALQDYIVKLIDNEAQLVGGKTLTQKAFDNKLEDAKVQLYARQKDLRTALLKIGDAEVERQKKIVAEQAKFASALVDIKYENGFISTQEYNRLKIDEQIRKILEEFPSLTQQQKEQVGGLIRNKQTQLRIVKEELELLRASNEVERRRIQLRREGYNEKKIQEIMDLEKIRDNIKATREIVDKFVNDTSSDYKGFLKAVINGEDAADALQQFQEGLQDRVVTIFLDFTMKPVEDFFKDVMGGKLIEKLFPKTALEGEAAKPTDPMQANTQATDKNTTAVDNLTNAISGLGAAAPAENALSFGGQFGAYGQGAAPFASMNSGVLNDALSFASKETSDKLNTFAYETTGFADNLNKTVEGIKTTTEDTKKAGGGFVQSLGGVVQGIGILASSAMTIMGGIQQINKGGTKNTLAGIGSILMGVGGGIGGFLNMGKAANGAVWQGGFRAFANGGTVQGPTLGLIGEGKYNEAIVPLPDGKSIPVQLNGDSIRDKMSGSSNGGGYASPVLSMNFETTTINNVEYVSRDQLERAMMETRRIATRDGARQGANLAIDKLQQSPTTRRRIGI